MRYNEEIDKKVNKMCPELDGKWQRQDSDQDLVVHLTPSCFCLEANRHHFFPRAGNFLLSN